MGLRELDSTYDQTGAAERKGGGPLPDGSYQVRVDKVSLEETNNGNPMLHFDCIVQAGPHQGSHIFFNRVITANTLAHTKADLSMLGWGTNKLSDLEDHNKLATILDKWIEVRQVTKGTVVVDGKTYPNANIYINKSLTPGVTPLAGETASRTAPRSPASAGPASPAGSPIVSRTVTHASPGVRQTSAGTDEPPF